MKTVLIVEDNAGFRATLKIALEDLGLRVLATGSPDAAYHILGTEHIDFALIDVRLPVSSGLVLYESINRNWPHLAGRTALITGYPEDVTEWSRARHVPVFEKPVRTEDLADWMRRQGSRVYQSIDSAIGRLWRSKKPRRSRIRTKASDWPLLRFISSSKSWKGQGPFETP